MVPEEYYTLLIIIGLVAIIFGPAIFLFIAGGPALEYLIAMLIFIGILTFFYHAEALLK